MPSDAEFAALTEPYRREIFAHCYRMLGSVHEAEDQVQETYLRAWRGFGRFEGRSSVRRWMYAIGTSTCLTALDTRTRRPLPAGLGPPSDDARVDLAPGDPSVSWLQPAPDRLLGTHDPADDPAAVVADRAGVRLAFVAALQVLSARQRAVLTLRDVLAFRTAEVAEILGTTPAAVDSTLRRARARLADAGPVADDLVEPQEEARLLDAYVDAFARGDAGALVSLLRADVELEMPPIPTWFAGRSAVIDFLGRRVLHGGSGVWHLVPTRANGQPAAVVFECTADGGHAAHGVDVLTVAGGRIARITAFNDASLVPTFCSDPSADSREGPSPVEVT